MERLDLRFQAANRAFIQFKKALQMPHNTDSRDIVLLRFQFTTEATWKLAQHFLREKEGLDINSPKSAVRGSSQLELISEEQAHKILEILDARNLIVHTYNEALAEQLYQKMPDYAQLLEIWISEIAKKL